jgi:hypothetical protein
MPRKMFMSHRDVPAKPATALFIVVIFSFLFTTQGCRSGYVMTDRGEQAYYQTGFPVQDTSRDITRIFESVRRLNVVGYYNTWVFDEEARVTDRDIRNADTYTRAAAQFSYSQAKAGTATIISRNEDHLILITNDHVVTYPDTVIFYYESDGRTTSGRTRSPEKFIERISVRVNQINMIYDMPRFGPFEVVARDPVQDIALIAIKIPRDEELRRISVMDVNVGDPGKLVWGSFVYVLGYPKGYKMVSPAIVSDPGRDRQDGFVIDGQFNEGISGGLILAVRGDTGQMEWVGMVRAASASSKIVLVPEEMNIEDYAFNQAYTGNIYLDVISQIEYGITLPVSVRAIQNFLRREDRRLRDRGFFMSGIFDR